MISLRLAAKIEENVSKIEDYEHAVIIAMHFVDTITKTRYIKSESFDDDAYQEYCESKSYDKFSAWMNKGILREQFVGPFMDKMLYGHDSDWNHVVSLFLYRVDKHFNFELRELDCFSSDAELMDCFKYLDNANSI